MLAILKTAAVSTPTQGLTRDDVDCTSPNNLSGQDSIQYCKGYEDGYAAQNNALPHK